MLQKIKDWVCNLKDYPAPQESKTRPLNSLKKYMGTPKVKYSADIVIGDLIKDGTSDNIEHSLEQWGKQYRSVQRKLRARG